MIFELRGVSLRFKDRVLFQNLNIQFKGSKIIALLGPSGCGKSTLIRLLSGLQKPTTGEVLRPAHLKFGFIFQESHLLNWRNTFENVQLPLELQDSGNAPSNAQDVESALKSVGLEKAAHLYPKELSGGMKMRASLARAFVTKPEVLFCDEPFAALDEVTRENLQTTLRERILNSEGMGFFVTHNLTEALSVADEIYYFTGPGQLATQAFQVDRGQKIENQLSELRTLVRGSF